MLLVDQKMEGVEAHLVRGDNFMGSVALINHLLSLGHHRIALLSPTRHYTHRELEVPPSYEVLVESGVSPEAELRALLGSEDRPTAIYAADPGYLGTLIRVAGELRLRIPEELSVVTFDDTYAALPEGYANFFTSVNQSGRLMGSMAVELLFRQWRDPELGAQKIVLPGKLNVADRSAGCNRTARRVRRICHDTALQFIIGGTKREASKSTIGMPSGMQRTKTRRC
ncbi:hypothetical protein YDYSG_29630 [Paenibacillus tyrfis]|uniref:substrate-binding domain-containing protein n=1 Tax=Paenibacillus tyrfis TaxID=1501230 RepID=UPI00249129D6|nr:substrate-binding domain-containing protein [Paenibacillus tyrfis]GLI06933.1 hypothetical protein YDYSG_29630 [Paenibacillus tyrfis]